MTQRTSADVLPLLTEADARKTAAVMFRSDPGIIGLAWAIRQMAAQSGVVTPGVGK